MNEKQEAALAEKNQPVLAMYRNEQITFEEMLEQVLTNHAFEHGWAETLTTASNALGNAGVALAEHNVEMLTGRKMSDG